MAETSKQDAGKSRDAASAFLDAALKFEAAPPGDPQVAAAIALGWRVGELERWETTGEAPADMLGLDAQARWAVLKGQVNRAVRDLADAPEATAAPAATNGAKTPELTARAEAPAEGAVVTEAPPADAHEAAEIAQFTGEPPEPGSQPAVANFFATALEQLYITAEALGKACRLGFTLQQVCAGADQAPAAERLIRAMPELKALLADLSTKLPANAGHSVRNSLTLWEGQLDALAKGTITAASATLDTTLLRQGETWRCILIGEVAAKDTLRLSDYVGTAEEMVRKLRILARNTLGRLIVPLVFIFALGIFGLVLLASADSDSTAKLTAGLTSVIASVGLTWKGIGTFFGKAAARGEQALWNAQVDWTIAYRATLPVAAPPRRRPRLPHRASEEEIRLRHLDTWWAWQRKWPDLDGLRHEAVSPPTKAVANPG